MKMKILVTGGASWVKIDEVRVISNIFTGKTSQILARYLAQKGCEVTLLVNPHVASLTLPASIQVLTFHYFAELKKLLTHELTAHRFDAVIHTAAVSDYLLKDTIKGKLPSGKEKITLTLTPAPKLTRIIQRLAQKAYLVQFKLEVSRDTLLKHAQESLSENKFDLVIANALVDLKENYRAFCLDREGIIEEVNSRLNLAVYLLKRIKASQKT